MQSPDCPMTVALYCRVSTDEQAQQGFSIASQHQRLEAYCVSQGWDDYAFYVDDGYSGTTLDRPALQRLLRDVAAGRIRAVVVYRLDRLGRRQKDVLHLLEDVFDPQGVVFQSATEPFDTATPLGKAMLGILAVFAQLERDTIVERTTMGRRQRISGGLWHGGRVPFGYRWDHATQTLTVHRAEAAVVQSVFRRFLSGESLSSLAEWANSQSRARSFTHTSIRQMLRRPIYAGYLNHAGELLRGQHQPIVDPATFAAAEHTLCERQQAHKRSGNYLLSGLIVCGVCGGSVIHIRRKGDGTDCDGVRPTYDYYGCKRQHQRARGETNRCSLGYYRQTDLDAAVMQAVQRVALEEEFVSTAAANRTDAAVISAEEEQRELEQLQREQAHITARLEQWYEAFETGQVAVVEVREHIRDLQQTRADIERRIAACREVAARRAQQSEAWLAPGPGGPEYLSPVPASQLLADTWPLLTEEERQAVVRAAVRRVVLKPGHKPPVIEWNV